MVQARVLDGTARLTAAIPPVGDRLSATLRRYVVRNVTLDDLVARDSLSPEAATFLGALMQLRSRVAVSGEPGAGQDHARSPRCSPRRPPSHCVRSCEEIRELAVPITHGSYYEVRPPALDGTGEISMRDLVKFVLAMRPDRIVVGEVRGAEAFELSRAVNAGCGFLCTVHANSASEALDALVNAALMAGENVTERIVRKVFSQSLDVVIHVDRDDVVQRRRRHRCAVRSWRSPRSCPRSATTSPSNRSSCATTMRRAAALDGCAPAVVGVPHGAASEVRRRALHDVLVRRGAVAVTLRRRALRRGVLLLLAGSPARPTACSGGRWRRPSRGRRRQQLWLAQAGVGVSPAAVRASARSRSGSVAFAATYFVTGTVLVAVVPAVAAASLPRAYFGAAGRPAPRGAGGVARRPARPRAVDRRRSVAHAALTTLADTGPARTARRVRPVPALRGCSAPCPRSKWSSEELADPTSDRVIEVLILASSAVARS